MSFFLFDWPEPFFRLLGLLIVLPPPPLPDFGLLADDDEDKGLLADEDLL